MKMKLVIRWIISTLALVAAVYLVPGIRVMNSNAWMVYAVMAIILGLVNALVRPFLASLVPSSEAPVRTGGSCVR